MVPSETPNPVGSGDNVPPQPPFPPSPLTQFSNNMTMSMPNISSLLNNNHSFVNGGSGESDIGFSGLSSSGQHFPNVSANQQQRSTKMEPQNFQQQRGGGLAGVKLEPGGQVSNDQQQQQKMLRSLGSVKLEPQQLQAMRNLAQVKMEPQLSEQSLFLQQQQQQQRQFLQMPPGQSPQTQMNIYQQQRLMQLQHQQHLLKSMPQQRPQLPQHQRPPLKPVYEPGMGAQRLTQYMYRQQHRPEDNNIEFWRKFVSEYFAPNAKKRWCVSMYGSGRQTTGVFPQDVWHCEICNRKPGRGFEATAEVLPRLFKIKYESGTLEELLYVDMPRESQNSSGQIVLEYAKATQESVFEQLRVVRDGQLRIVFSPDLKIFSWEFCARRHEELIPRRLLIPQVSQLGSAAQKYQQAAQNATTDSALPELQNNCNMFVASARQLAKALEVPLVNDLGYTKRYVRCLQISEVVNSMKDLIDYSRETRTGPVESLAKFPRRTGPSSALPGPSAQQPNEQLRQQQQQQQQSVAQIANNDQSCGQSSLNYAFSAAPASTSTSSIAGLIHQNSMKQRHQNAAYRTPSSPYGGNSIQMQSPSSSGTMAPSSQQQQQHNLPSFQSPTSSSNRNYPSQNGIPSINNHMGSTNLPAVQQAAAAAAADEANESSSVQKILNEILMNNQAHNTSGGGHESFGNDGKGGSDVNSSGVLMMNGQVNTTSMGGFGGGMGQSMGMNNINGNNGLMNGRVGMMVRDPNVQQDVGNQLLGAVNGFNSFQCDWNV
ncbi:Transcriptional corepressor SEUSS [Raphanus sativus]|uniref:Transcriptional corepressor SEUSS n=1 Tax=Raphanus sativus TaxID=3726 RepID=A0A6J0NII8_RAPSA|nr:transcriptional corepressor SEUSS [Raphanus sativus]XP_018483933.1 transcriptional corepressor SEUSS [Raphanus sativus]XP_018483934.1 transcriptional corepressor SEUSS [Raphanus sativus]XP_018483935.1 transcriptional corepressor SEUSS [Raphanus sativus]XP_018483936.1 transcriptional corepressor SEUSS [Raphanus sativus]XP_056842992.1 transcriptional corepressor SEUSS [Raphanus sativus]KAJ4917288.1 Transcriptional corepressor SEUSS [Raphanus sativus]